MKMRKKFFFMMILLALFALGIEGAYRIRSLWREKTLLPYALVSEKNKELLQSWPHWETSYTIFDPDLGWALRPSVRKEKEDFFYQTNSQGLRASSEYALTPPPQTLRIALFGDSFIHGDEVAFSATLGAYLEKEISEIQSETLNFGISGYGTDQAVLMYEKRGQAYHPHVVLLGFLTEHIARNINRFRRFYIPELETPFLSKPRFLLDSSGSLSLASPLCYSPQEVLVLIQKNDLKLLTQDEYFYFPECYTPAWTDFSLFLRELRTRFVKKRIKAFYRPKNLFQNPEVTEISFQILKRFCSEAQKAQAFPLIVTFHFLQDFEKWKEEGPYWKNFVQRCQEQDLPILDIGSLLAQDPHFLKNPKAHFLPQGHYHPKLTERVAQEIKNTLYKNSQFLQKLRALNSFKKD